MASGWMDVRMIQKLINYHLLDLPQGIYLSSIYLHLLYLHIYKSDCLYAPTYVCPSFMDQSPPNFYRLPLQLKEGSKDKYDPSKKTCPRGHPNFKNLADYWRKALHYIKCPYVCLCTFCQNELIYFFSPGPGA